MHYEHKDKVRAERAARVDEKIKRYQLFEDADLFEEYELQADLNGVAKHRLLDPLWWYYQLENHPKRFSVIAWLAIFIVMFPVGFLVAGLLRGIIGVVIGVATCSFIASAGTEILKNHIQLVHTRLRGLWIERSLRKWETRRGSQSLSSAYSVNYGSGGSQISISLSC